MAGARPRLLTIRLAASVIALAGQAVWLGLLDVDGVGRGTGEAGGVHACTRAEQRSPAFFARPSVHQHRSAMAVDISNIHLFSLSSLGSSLSKPSCSYSAAPPPSVG
jgi:hypothetical protein